MNPENLLMMSTVIASGLVQHGGHAEDPDGTAEKAIRIAKAITAKLDPPAQASALQTSANENEA